MTTLRPFTCNDMFKFNNVNLDPLTKTYDLFFYMQYLAHWPEYFQVAESPSGEIMGYIMGKAEGHGESWHGHVTSLTVSPEYRRLGLAATLMAWLEDVSEKKRAYFVDLFVRVSNKVAINMYKRLGYIVYRTVIEYYSGDPDEDAFDMRKALSRDVKKKSVVPLTHPVRPEDVDLWRWKNQLFQLICFLIFIFFCLMLSVSSVILMDRRWGYFSDTSRFLTTYFQFLDNFFSCQSLFASKFLYASNKTYNCH